MAPVSATTCPPIHSLRYLRQVGWVEEGGSQGLLSASTGALAMDEKWFTFEPASKHKTGLEGAAELLEWYESRARR